MDNDKTDEAYNKMNIKFLENMLKKNINDKLSSEEISFLDIITDNI